MTDPIPWLYFAIMLSFLLLFGVLASIKFIPELIKLIRRD